VAPVRHEVAGRSPPLPPRQILLAANERDPPSASAAMVATTVADNVSTRRAPLSANPSRKSLRLRARAPMIASGYNYVCVRFDRKKGLGRNG
jgi:hypothetical protein